jgi:hypothetical protein
MGMVLLVVPGLFVSIYIYDLSSQPEEAFPLVKPTAPSFFLITLLILLSFQSLRTSNMYIKSLVVASAALTLVSAESYPRGAYPINKRTQGPDEPSCTDFTPFQYAGCFQDTSAPRSLVFSGPSTSNMTVETCVAFCKGWSSICFYSINR